MMDKRKYHIVVGSKAFFDDSIWDFSADTQPEAFLELVRLSDVAKQSGKAFIEKTDKLIVKNSDYHGIVVTAHDRLGSLIEDLTTDDAEIYIHNPPRTLRTYLEDQYSRSLIEIDDKSEEYGIKRDSDAFVANITDISSNLFGQQCAIEEISKSLWYLTTVKREKPYVIMLYGNSSIGKTELAREVSQKFFGGKCLEKHLSMFKNDNYSDYFFGDAPNRKSLGFDLLERESNLIFFDEMDKCPEYFFSAFYTLFDNTQFKDATYDVDVSGIVIILTSNYQTEDEMKKQLGLPIFYRIDKMIHFDDFNCDTIYAIVRHEIDLRKSEYEGKLTTEMVYAAVSPLIFATGENARTIKYKVQQVIEELLFKEVKEKIVEQEAVPPHLSDDKSSGDDDKDVDTYGTSSSEMR
ncbi:MAG: AAA family ATPase [Akkermansiaceae bacterium]|nr:AAA family ATPase [Akkermansiaceae bacterium]